jgi:hypothetical protein
MYVNKRERERERERERPGLTLMKQESMNCPDYNPNNNSIQKIP